MYAEINENEIKTFLSKGKKKRNKGAETIEVWCYILSYVNDLNWNQKVSFKGEESEMETN